jgi:hypothetical protein
MRRTIATSCQIGRDELAQQHDRLRGADHERVGLGVAQVLHAVSIGGSKAPL